MDWIFCGITVLVAFLALQNWRTAIYACIILDVTRDLARKLTPGYPIFPTLIVGLVWVAALLGASTSDARELKKLTVRYPLFQSVLMGVLFAILPGALISLVRYENGWILSLMGGISYFAPFIGVYLGYLWPRRVQDVLSWLSLYVIVNSIVLIGTLLEAYHFNVPGLGGMKMVWLRNHGEDLVKLIAGFYRSPDVMGLHAAFVMMFAATLALSPSSRIKWVWWLLACWASSCLLLSGRRKFIAMPMLFLCTYTSLYWTSGTQGKRIALVAVFFGACVVAGLYFLTQLQETSDDYSRFASSIMVEGIDRVGQSFTSIIQVTIEQAGWLGDGLGSATQGSHYTGVKVSKGWQEDGVGRLFKEVGIPGVVLFALTGSWIVRVLFGATKIVPPSAAQTRQLQFAMTSIVVANAGSFVVSHQAYSGDPSTVLIVGFCLGMVLGMPRIAFGTD